MNKPTGGLGRGLSSLIPQQVAVVPEAEPVKKAESADSEVPIDLIVENPHQPRKYFAPEELEDLASSIREHGIMQPLVVTKKEDGTFELIAGERRLRASKLVGLKKVPVVVRSASEQQKLELALIENIQRQNLNAVEEAIAYQSLIDQFSLRQEDVAKRVGKSRSHVTNTLRLLELDEPILQAISEGKITRSHARTLLQEPNPSKRRDLFGQMINGGMTVREAEARAGNPRRFSAPDKDPNIAAIERELREQLGTKVKIKMNGGTGTLSLHFYSRDELKGFIDQLTK